MGSKGSSLRSGGGNPSPAQVRTQVNALSVRSFGGVGSSVSIGNYNVSRQDAGYAVSGPGIGSRTYSSLYSAKRGILRVLNR